MNANKTTAEERRNPEMGRRLKEARKALGLKQEDIAKQLGFTTTAYQNYEYGREISSGRLIQICAILECSPNWLLGYHDEGMRLAPDSLLLKQLRDAFDQLNETGKQKAVECVQNLTYVPAYVGEVKNGGSDSTQEVS